MKNLTPTQLRMLTLLETGQRELLTPEQNADYVKLKRYCLHHEIVREAELDILANNEIGGMRIKFIDKPVKAALEAEGIDVYSDINPELGLTTIPGGTEVSG